jgi:hypothetical protein
MGGVIVGDDMDVEIGRALLTDQLEEGEPFLMTSLPRPPCLVPEDWRDGARLWQAVCFLRERRSRGETQLVPVVHRRDPRACVATATRLAARRA